MKKLMIALMAGLMSALAMAKGIEQISVVENEMTTIAVPFGITSYLPSNMDVVRIEEVDGTTLRITALRRGRCDLDVRGDKDLSQKYEITVLGDLATTLDTLNSELDNVQEVRARVVGDFIRIDGEISSIQKWEYLQKVIRNYKGVVRNFAIFSPGPDVMLRLKETLQDGGFTVVFQSMGKDRKAWPANQIALVLNKATQMMTIQGRVYTPEQMSSVHECLNTERWLTLDPKPTTEEDNEYRIRGRFDVFVDKPQIRISLAYMAIGEEDIKNIGNQNALKREGVLNLGGVLSSLSGLLKTPGEKITKVGDAVHQVSYKVGLNAAANFLKQNGISRVSDSGYTVMESWDKDGASFKSGGTLFARTETMTQSQEGEVPAVMMNAGNSEMKEIPYGFELKTKGGVIETGNEVELAVDFSLSSISQLDQWGVDRKEETTKQKLRLAIGSTTFLGGRKMIDDSRTSPSGIPFLRNTPMLNWFVSDSGTSISDRRLVIMVCPEIVDNTTAGTPEVSREINIPVTTEGVKTTEQREDEKMEKAYPFKGGLWNPGNWFVF